MKVRHLEKVSPGWEFLDSIKKLQLFDTPVSEIWFHDSLLLKFELLLGPVRNITDSLLSYYYWLRCSLKNIGYLQNEL